MPVTLTYPGVYIEEIESGVRTIIGVSTSVTAFVGYTTKGPVNKAIKIFNFGAFVREFGGMAKDSEISYAVQQFFLNGGTEAWIVRVAAGAAKASIIMKNGTGGTAKKTLIITAKSEGAWGNNLRLEIDNNTSNPYSTFNLTVTEYKLQGTKLLPGRSELHRNLSMDKKSSQYAVNVISTASQLIDVFRHAEIDAAYLSNLEPGWSLSGDLSMLNLPNVLDDTKRFISIIVDGDGPYEVPIFTAGTQPADLVALATNIENAVKSINPGLDRFSKFKVGRADARGNQVPTGNFLKLTSGSPNTTEREQSSVHVFNASSNSASQTLRLGFSNGGREREAATALSPIQTGTISGDLADLTSAKIAALNTGHEVTVTIANGTNTIGSGTFKLDSPVNSLPELAKRMQEQIRKIDPNNPALSSVTVKLIGTSLHVMSDTEATDSTITLANVGAGTLATDIRINSTNADINIQKYEVGVGVDRGAQVDRSSGVDGTPPNAQLLCGSQDKKEGIYALEDANIFNLLCIPYTAEMDETSALAVLSEATSYCTKRRAFLIVDPLKEINSVEGIKSSIAKLTRSNYAALYFPFVMVPDSLDNYRLKPLPPSGTIAGLYARTDSARGIWKAPAGIEATLANVQDLAYSLTDMENGDLNQLAVNCLRIFPIVGRVAWGARTLRGADQLTDEYKYIPVRRLALYIEESLYRGTQWVVFEPNDEPLWAQIRLNIGAFMHNLFRQGAFKGKTPQEAYFVKCDKETTTQDDINRGIVNIVVGFAPLKPAEFVVIKIQQIAGQIQT